MVTATATAQPAKCPGNERETYRQADKLTNRQTIHAIQQWLSNKACSRKTAGKAGQKDMRLLLLARKCAEGNGKRGEWVRQSR